MLLGFIAGLIVGAVVALSVAHWVDDEMSGL